MVFVWFLFSFVLVVFCFFRVFFFGFFLCLVGPARSSYCWCRLRFFFWQICLAIIAFRAGGFSPYWAVAVQRIDVPLCEQPSFPTSPWYFHFGYRKVIKYRKLCASATVAAIKSGAESRLESSRIESVWAVAWHLTPF